MKSLWIAVSMLCWQGAASAAVTPLSMDKAITWKALNREYKVAFTEMKLIEATSWLEDALRADCGKCTQLHIDEKFLHDRNISLDTIVNFQNDRALPAVTILETILREVHPALGFRVDDGGKIDVAAANSERVTRAEAMTWVQLQSKMNVDFNENELVDVLAYLQELSAYRRPKALPLQFFVERSTFQRGEGSRRITLSLKKVSIYDILNKILTDRKLSFKIDPLSGLILIQG